MREILVASYDSGWEVGVLIDGKPAPEEEVSYIKSVITALDTGDKIEEFLKEYYRQAKTIIYVDDAKINVLKYNDYLHRI